MTHEDEVRAAFVEGLTVMADAVRASLKKNPGKPIQVEVDVEAAWSASESCKNLREKDPF